LGGTTANSKPLLPRNGLHATPNRDPSKPSGVIGQFTDFWTGAHFGRVGPGLLPGRRHSRLGRLLVTYNCRDCPIRDRCIEESNTAPSVKLMMRRAFETGRDTHDMWGLLYNDCLLLRQEREQARPHRPSLLSQRIKGKTEPAEAAQEVEGAAPPPSVTMPPRPAPIADRRPTGKPSPARPVAAGEREEEAAPARYCIALQGSKHRIALPIHGEIVLGRFDPMISSPPDVDLSYDDREHLVISRRHARIVGHNGRHEIEDLGSTNGTLVNQQRLRIGQRVRLQTGDRVALGYCEFVYALIPEVPTSSHAAPSQAYLWSTFTGHRFPLPLWGEVVVGRSDPAVGFAPDVDLSQEGDVAQVVARRHVKIVARGGRHYVEDLGSANGTRLNGARLGIGELSPLNPGDHIWLGGCVLAYDLEL